jgi:hypothetical protein
VRLATHGGTHGSGAAGGAAILHSAGQRAVLPSAGGGFGYQAVLPGLGDYDGAEQIRQKLRHWSTDIRLTPDDVVVVYLLKVAWKLSRHTTVIDPIAPAVSEGVVYLDGPTLTARKAKPGKEVWSLPAKSEQSKTRGGWGPPVIDGDALYAQDGTEISRRDKRDGKTDWAQHTQGDTQPQLVPLVVQGDSLWATQDITGEEGVAVLHKDSGDRAWTYSRGQGGHWLMVGAGNRVFLARMGSVTAMPVF